MAQSLAARRRTVSGRGWIHQTSKMSTWCVVSFVHQRSRESTGHPTGRPVVARLRQITVARQHAQPHHHSSRPWCQFQFGQLLVDDETMQTMKIHFQSISVFHRVNVQGRRGPIEFFQVFVVFRHVEHRNTKRTTWCDRPCSSARPSWLRVAGEGESWTTRRLVALCRARRGFCFCFR